ncbi:MAG: hypothetical protein E7170_05135 [Firmicutes bacterium]|nr:hypothetical protein [Bacillota bacterium]
MEQNISKKSKNIKIIVGIVIGVVCFGMLFMYFYKLMPIVTGSVLHGEWDCDVQIVELNKDKTFAMYYKEDKNKLNVLGTYEYEADEKNPLKYDVTMKTTDRTLLGEKYTEEYINDYQIIVEKEGKRMVMTNLNTNSIYACTKVK